MTVTPRNQIWARHHQMDVLGDIWQAAQLLTVYDNTIFRRYSTSKHNRTTRWSLSCINERFSLHYMVTLAIKLSCYFATRSAAHLELIVSLSCRCQRCPEIDLFESDAKAKVLLIECLCCFLSWSYESCCASIIVTCNWCLLNAQISTVVGTIPLW
jgi:hypothetical protein